MVHISSAALPEHLCSRPSILKALKTEEHTTFTNEGESLFSEIFPSSQTVKGGLIPFRTSFTPGHQPGSRYKMSCMAFDILYPHQGVQVNAQGGCARYVTEHCPLWRALHFGILPCFPQQSSWWATVGTCIVLRLLLLPVCSPQRSF